MICRRIPVTTYRLQFNKEFGFADAQALVPYLHALGVTDIYASPLLEARKGSVHGYDVTNPTLLNPELGNSEAFTNMVKTLQQHDMALLLDIVPNHMAASVENPWWRDVLQYGPDSPYSSYFDIDWRPFRHGLADRVMLPVLGSPYGQVLENQELTLILTEDGFQVVCNGSQLPLKPESYKPILGHRLQELTGRLGPGHPAVSQIKNLFVLLNALPARRAKDFAGQFRDFKAYLWRLYHTVPEINAFLDGNLRLFNGQKGNPQSFNHLDRLLEEQAYKLSFWKAANQEVNYRRFFNVSELVSLHAEKEYVFSATHSLVLQMAGAGLVNGLRIDHIDGLHDPLTYLRRLQERLPGTGQHDFYIVVEKILSGDEELPAQWPVHGTTGYNFLNRVNGLFVYGPGFNVLDEIYRRLRGSEADFDRVVYTRKRRVMADLFGSDVRHLTQQLGRLAEQDRYGHDLTLNQLERSLVEITAALPVYRTYINSFDVGNRDREYISNAIAAAAKRYPVIERGCNFLKRVLLLDFPEYMPEAQRRKWLGFVMRWQQFTGPIMAKGIEDTAMYVYNRLISLNEVGGEPHTTGVTVEEFHCHNLAMQQHWPHTLNPTSTHDTKRSEDVRIRINILSEIPVIWAEHLEQWRKWNKSKKPEVDGQPVPDGNFELLIYQTLLGAWPLHEERVPQFKERLQKYLVKSAKEAKIYTNWSLPYTAYEEALASFALSILEPSEDNHFLQDFLRFQKKIAYYGALGSLAQVLLKITSPGVPDFYRGTELWDFSLVDPDNRRPVDFQTRASLLAELRQQEAGNLLELAQKLLLSWDDGRVKLFLTYKALHFRRAYQQIFKSGEYIPVQATGPRYNHVCAFMRHFEDDWALVAVPRLMARLCMENQWPLVEDTPPGKYPSFSPILKEGVWGNDALMLPAKAPDSWHNILTGETINAVYSTVNARASEISKVLSLAGVFRELPFALLKGGADGPAASI